MSDRVPLLKHCHTALLLTIVLPLLTGCVVGPDYCAPQTPVPDLWNQRLEQGDHVGSKELTHWWTLLGDPVLDELIELADDGNLDLYAALTRIQQARSQLCISRSTLFPQFNKTGSYQNLQQSVNAFGGAIAPGAGGGAGGFLVGEPFDLWAKALDISWEANVFGRVTRQIEAQCANAQATVEAYRDVMVLLYSEVAASYVRVRTTQEQLNFALRNVELQERALELASKRVEGGVAPILEQQQAESNLALTESEIPQLETQLQLELNRLAVLLGQYPGAVHERLAEPAPIPDPQGGLPASLPCDMIRQRPDIRLAERRIAVRTAELGVAIADLYPRFTINGRFRLESRNLSNLLDGDSFAYNVGPDFTWPLFQAGRILCNIELADAVLEESVAVYEQAILLAVEEVENAVVSYHKERERFEDLQRTVKASEATLESVLKTYRAGKTDFLNVINSFQTLFVAQNNLAISEGSIVVQLITIYKALGGGWDPNHHCQERCVRLRCPNRVEPGVADITEVEDPTERYFGVQPDTKEEGDDADPDPFGDLEDDPSNLPPPDATDQPRELLFEDELERLQERLKQLPQEVPSDESAQSSRPQRQYADVSLKDFW